MSDFTWWEKTVEYLFVVRATQEGKISLMPLDGHHEQAGDLIFSDNKRMLLIEFKRNKESLKSEKEKFYCYELAKKNLIKYAEHHCLIWGALSTENEVSLVLMMKQYFKEPIEGIGLNFNELFTGGTDQKRFDSYLLEFIDSKKIEVALVFPPYSPTGGGPNGGDGAVLDYSVVAVLDVNDQIVHCIPLSTYMNIRFDPPAGDKVSRIPPVSGGDVGGDYGGFFSGGSGTMSAGG